MNEGGAGRNWGNFMAVKKVNTETSSGIKSTSTRTRASAQEPASAGKKVPLLSICIPTYKRGKFVEAQVRSAIELFLKRDDVEVELVVVNNMSPDDTKQRLQKFSHPNFKLINRTQHYDTAEENMIRSLEFLSGDYVWFLGDDDPIKPNAVDRTLSLLQTHKYSCIIFNSSTISPDGNLIDMRPMPMHGPQVSGPIDEIIEMIGLINTFAGISNIIQLRSRLDAERGLEWMRTSKIYSHVAWFVEAHRGEMATFVNLPLVYYRQNDYSDGHWDRVAERLGVQSLFFWSLGITRLVQRLVNLKCLTIRQAGQIFELASGGFRYRLIDDIVFKTYTQLLSSCQAESQREVFTKDEINEISQFILNCDPSLYNLIDLLSEAHEAIQSARGNQKGISKLLPSNSFNKSLLADIAKNLSEKFLQGYSARQKDGQFVCRCIGVVFGYCVYRMPQAFVAIKESETSIRDKALSFVDPIADKDLVYVGGTYEDLVDQLIVRLDRQNEVRPNFNAVSGDGGAAVLASLDPAIISQLQDAAAVFKRQAQENENLHVAAATRLSALYDSSSWRLTGPIRAISRSITGRG